VGIISAFNFPVAVWAWNAAIAAICGNVSVWKPSEKTPFTAIACQKLLDSVLRKNNLPEGVFSLVLGDATIGQAMSADHRVALVSATGSTRMGKAVAVTVAQRLGKSLLELGGNNAIIIAEDSNLDMAIRSTVFGAVGTCGQRCTSTRRLIVHASRYEEVKNRLVEAYRKLPIGNPLDESKLVGPLVDAAAEKAFFNAITEVQKEGGKLIVGGTKVEELAGGCYVHPAIVEAENHYHMVQEETFAPILYLLKYDGDLDNAIAIQNNVKQGLSSAIFTNRLQEAERFLNWRGSDCGIANVNIGTSGAEIGGAFGGEKETGGGRESGSDSWRAYMRRQTNTINYSNALPLAQGIKFEI
jgi:aldehyde dehydrogenase (NAD+)